MRPTRKPPKQFLACLAIVLNAGAWPAWPQATSTSTVAGLVTDESTTAVAGAEVRMVDSATGGKQTTLTNEPGRYVMVNVAPGTYVITIAKEGFTVFRINAQKVDVGTAITINGALKVG